MIGATERDSLTERGVPVTRRLEPTRCVPSGMAAEHAWPLSLDHRFTRVRLDAAARRWDRPWHEAVRRTATRHLSLDRPCRAVAVAADSARLPPLNRRRLRLRGHPHR